MPVDDCKLYLVYRTLKPITHYVAIAQVARDSKDATSGSSGASRSGTSEGGAISLCATAKTRLVVQAVLVGVEQKEALYSEWPAINWACSYS